MSTVAIVTFTCGSPPGSMGGGSTAAMTSGSVRYVDTSVVAHTSTEVASTSRLRSWSSDLAPYLILAITPPHSIPAYSRSAGERRTPHRLGWDLLDGQDLIDLLMRRTHPLRHVDQAGHVELVELGRVPTQHLLHLGNVEARERAPERGATEREARLLVGVIASPHDLLDT